MPSQGIESIIKDNSQEVLDLLQQNIDTALNAMGLKAVEFILDKMKNGYNDPHPNRDWRGEVDGSGYHTDIRWTGDLMRAVNYEFERSGKNTVDVGNSLFTPNTFTKALVFAMFKPKCLELSKNLTPCNLCDPE